MVYIVINELIEEEVLDGEGDGKDSDFEIDTGLDVRDKIELVEGEILMEIDSISNNGEVLIEF